MPLTCTCLLLCIDLSAATTVPGKGYHIFAGKDGSRGLGKSSLKPEDAVADYSTLDDKELKVLDDWVRLTSALA